MIAGPLGGGNKDSLAGAAIAGAPNAGGGAAAGIGAGLGSAGEGAPNPRGALGASKDKDGGALGTPKAGLGTALNELMLPDVAPGGGGALIASEDGVPKGAGRPGVGSPGGLGALKDGGGAPTLPILKAGAAIVAVFEPPLLWPPPIDKDGGAGAGLGKPGAGSPGDGSPGDGSPGAGSPGAFIPAWLGVLGESGKLSPSADTNLIMDVPKRMRSPSFIRTFRTRSPLTKLPLVEPKSSRTM